MDNPQYYQPLSHALHAPVVATSHSSPRQSYAHYAPHQQPPVTNGAGSGHREEEEEEDDDDEDVVEEELDHHDADHLHQSASSHSSPRVNAAQSQSSSAGCVLPNRDSSSRPPLTSLSFRKRGRYPYLCRLQATCPPTGADPLRCQRRWHGEAQARPPSWLPQPQTPGFLGKRDEGSSQLAAPRLLSVPPCPRCEHVAAEPAILRVPVASPKPLLRVLQRGGRTGCTQYSVCFTAMFAERPCYPHNRRRRLLWS